MKEEGNANTLSGSNSISNINSNINASSYETTPLLSFTSQDDANPSRYSVTYPTEGPPSNRNYINTSGKYVSTSGKYGNNSGKYVKVPKYPSNRNYQQGSSIYKTLGIPAVLVTIIFQSIGFTLVLPSMYLYLTTKIGGAESFYGWIVAVYSVGSLLGSILFGYWSDHRTSKEAISVAALISITGNCLYVAIEFLPHHYGHWFMLLSRLFVGFGSGCVAVCRAFCSEAVDFKTKVKAMAAVSAAQGIGFVIGPGIGSVLSLMDFKVYIFRVDQYTSPGYLSALLCLISFIVVVVYMPATATQRVKKAEVADNEVQAPIYISLCLFFAAVSVFAIFETDFTVLSKRDFGWDTLKNSLYFLVAAVISTIVYFIIGGVPTLKRVDERKATIVGYLVLIAGMLSFVKYDKPWPLEKGLHLVQIFVGGVLFSIGYPIASTYIFTLYSKILNPTIQGSKMGLITAAGSLARMLGPIWATTALNGLGDTAVFGGTALFVILALLLLLVSFKKLVPHKDYGKDNSLNA